MVESDELTNKGRIITVKKKKNSLTRGNAKNERIFNSHEISSLKRKKNGRLKSRC